MAGHRIRGPRHGLGIQFRAPRLDAGTQGLFLGDEVFTLAHSAALSQIGPASASATRKGEAGRAA